MNLYMSEYILGEQLTRSTENQVFEYLKLNNWYKVKFLLYVPLPHDDISVESNVYQNWILKSK